MALQKEDRMEGRPLESRVRYYSEILQEGLLVLVGEVGVLLL